VPSLAPEIMPAPGSDVTPALKRAYQLFQDGGASRGRILLITDEIRDRASAEALASEYKKQYPVSVLAVGTASGAPISADHLTANGGYLKDSNGNLVIPKVDFSSMQEFATAAGGRFSRMTLTDADLKYLLGGPQLPDDEFRTLERDFDVWFEEGPWLLLLLLPLGALAFRRGWLWCLLPLMVLMHSQPADASVWDDLWQTQDQQAAQAMRQGDARQAAQLFKNPAWKAAAQYRSKDYANAAKDFESIDTSDGHYNRGNALARQGKLKDAIEAYDKALAMNPDNQDATYNKKLVEQLLKKQQQQHKQQDKQGKNQQDKDKQKNGQGQQGENQKQQQGKQGKQGKQNPASQSGANQQAQQEKGDNQKQGQAGEQQDAQKKKAREEQARQAKAAKDKQKGEKQRQAPADNDNLSEEQRQALQQWLRRVPDDPGGLLRRKFAQQHQQRLQNGESEPDDSKNNW